MARQITDGLLEADSLAQSAGADSFARNPPSNPLSNPSSNPLSNPSSNPLSNGAATPDSLQSDVWADSLYGAGTDSLYGAWTDSLRNHGGDVLFGDGAWSAADGVKDVAMSSADAVFGPFSSLAQQAAIPQTIAEEASPLTGSIFFDVSVLACFVAMCLIFFLYRGYSSGIFNVLRGGATTEKMLGDQGKVFGAFLSRTIAAGLLVAGLAVLKFTDLLFAERISALPEWASLAAIPAVWAAAALIWGYKFVFLKIAGSLTLSQAFTSRLFFLKKITFSIWTVTVMPLFLLFALADGRSAHIIGYVMVATTVLIWVFFLVRTFMLFVRHNFSISLWILYLCAVEIFPVSFAAVAAYRFWLNY